MKYSIFLVVLLIAGQAHSQISFGPEAGVNATSYFVSSASAGDRSPLMAGFRGGIKADFTLQEHFHVRAGALYANSFYVPGANLIGGGHPEMYIHALEAPIQFSYFFSGNKMASPFVGVGAFLSYIAGGRYYLPGGDMPPGMKYPDVTRKLNVGTTLSDDIKPLDGGISITAGLQMKKGLCLSVLVQRGMENLQPIPAVNSAFKSFSLGLNVGWYFHCCPAQREKQKDDTPSGEKNWSNKLK